MSTEFQTIRYETTDTGIARITLAMPEKRNAQTVELLVELNTAMDQAAHNDDIKVIVLAADDPDFSSGHAGIGNINRNPPGAFGDRNFPADQAKGCTHSTVFG